MTTAALVLKRWRRFGHDRLYVTDAAGVPVGWADLSSGLLHPVSAEHQAALNRAVADWRAGAVGVRNIPQPLSWTWSPPVRPAPKPAAPSTVPAPGVVRSAPAPVSAASPTPPVSQRPWTDLAANPPGWAARAQAGALRDAAPVRTFFARLVNLRTPERAWRIGADGEELVGAELAQLVRSDPRWRVLHAVPVGVAGADIDHLVMGPGGVFSLNTKHHPRASLWVAGDTFLVNGQRQPYVRNSRHEAGRAARLLTAASGVPLRVHGVIVPVDGCRLTVKSAPRDVAVVPRQQLRAWLRSWGQVLDDAPLATVAEVARRSTTWR